MAQKTTASAFTRLKPLSGTNLGAIVEEHIRYWNRVKDEKEAKKLADQARQDEFARKIAESQGKAFDVLMAKAPIALGDSKGYLRDQNVKDYIENQPALAELARKAVEGDTEAKILYSNKLLELRERTSLDKIFETQALALTEQANDYNDAVDRGDLEFFQGLLKNFYAIKDGKFITLNETFTVSELKDRIQSLKFSGKVDFNELGADIAKNIKLTDVNGNRIIDSQIDLVGTRNARSQLLKSETILKSWAFAKGIPREELDDLDEIAVANLSKSFYEEKIRPSLQTKDNTLANQARRSTEAGKLLDREKKEQALIKPSLTISTDENGKPLKSINTGKFGIFKGKLFKTGKDGVSVTKVKKGGKNEITTIHTFVMTASGRIIGVGNKIIVTPEVRVGNEIQEKKTSKVEPVLITSRNELNQYALQYDGINNIGELADLLKELSKVKDKKQLKKTPISQ